MKKPELHALLQKWGRWKRNSVLSVGGGGTLEAKLMSKEIMGDGCVGGGKDLEKINGVRFLHDEVAEKINSEVLQLKATYAREMYLLEIVYVFGWSERKIAEDLAGNRRTIAKLVVRAKNLLESRLINLDLSGDPNQR